MLTGVDLQDEHAELYASLARCNDYRAVIATLTRTAEDFELYRHPASSTQYAKLRKALRPLVRTVLSAGILEAGGEAASATVRLC